MISTGWMDGWMDGAARWMKDDDWYVFYYLGGAVELDCLFEMLDFDDEENDEGFWGLGVGVVFGLEIGLWTMGIL